jgi:hypothetical protein
MLLIWVFWLNPRVEGVFEAVSYLKEFAVRYGGRDRFVELLERELESLMSDIARGTAVDFRSRLKDM